MGHDEEPIEILQDADLTPGLRDDPPPIGEDSHAQAVGAFADGGSAMVAHDPIDGESGIAGLGDRASVTGIGAGNRAIEESTRERREADRG